jgi:acetyl-CoA carboxylase carboxyl transferase subunit beta
LTELFADWRHRRAPAPPEEPEPPPPRQCTRCRGALDGTELYERLRVCPHCGYHYPLGARERIAALADPGSFRETHAELISVDPLRFSDRMPYQARLAEAQRRTGLSEAVVTGTLRVEGHPAVVAVLDFEFLGGSMGSVVGEKVALAFELAARQRWPLIAVVGSGGARMQEGMLSLMQMAKTAAAARRLHAARVPYIVVLTHPTTGGVFASFASLGDIHLAEPGALIGFAGPRVREQTGAGSPAAAGERSHSAEFLHAHGFVDAVVPRPELRATLATLLRLLAPAHVPRREPPAESAPAPPEGPRPSAWETVQLARHPARPTALDYIRGLLPDFYELHGDQAYGDDPAVVVGLGTLDGQPVAAIGLERDPDDPRRRGGRALPEGYRKAQRMMRLAAKFRLPLLTFVDTPGAEAGVEAEARGLAHAIAHCLARMVSLPVPTIAVVIGEGGSGGALALAVADRVLMQEHAIFSVISPEGASAILYRDATQAPVLAPALRITAPDLLELGIIDTIVPEPAGGAHTDPAAAVQAVHAAVARELPQLLAIPPGRLVRTRYQRYRRIGPYTSRRRAAIARHLAHVQETMHELQEHLQHGFERLRERLPRPATAP